MKATTFVPETGDLVWVDFDPQKGREQSGRGLALVLSPAEYNSVVGLFVVCPVAAKIKGYPFEVPLPPGSKIKGAVLADHIKSLDWRRGSAELAVRLDRDGALLHEVRIRLRPLLGFDFTQR